MDIKIQGTSTFHVSERTRDYIHKRVEKLNYFKDHINEINFHISSEKLIYKISATLSINKFGINKFEAGAEEIYTAIDKIVHKMDVKINREKSKIQSHNHPDHQQVVEFFYEHDKNIPEPTKDISINTKPTTLLDAYLQMKVEGNDFYGFNLIQEEQQVAPAFLRILEDNVLYLFKAEGNNLYAEYSVKTAEKSAEMDKKVREIQLKTMGLLEAQRDVLELDYHFTLYFNEYDKVAFLFKEGNGKWKCIS